MTGIKTITFCNQWRDPIEVKITGKEPLGWLYVKFGQADPSAKQMLYFWYPSIHDVGNVSKTLAELGLTRDMKVWYILGSGRKSVLTDAFYEQAQRVHDAFEAAHPYSRL